jgi:thermitase
MRRSPVVLLVALVALLGIGVGVLAPAAHAAADPLRPQQWHLDALDAADAWRLTQGRDVVVAVVDTGVQADHPDLEGRVLPGRDFVAPGSPPEDENGHGTLVAGLIAAVLDNGVGGAGLAPRSRVLPVRVLDADGRGDDEDVARGIRWAVANGADIVNLSLTETPGDTTLAIGLITPAIERAIRDARRAGVLVVGAAGNEGAESTPYGARVPLVVVGASDRDGAAWQDSNRDSRTLFAPGVEMISTFSGGGYARADGTSFAAPLVAAAAALLLAREPDLDVESLERRLLDTATPIGVGAGRLDLTRAIGSARAAGAQPPAAPAPAASPSPSPSPAGTSAPPAARTPEPVDPPPADPPPAHPAPEEAEEAAEPVQAVPPEPAITPLPEPTEQEPLAAPEEPTERPVALGDRSGTAAPHEAAAAADDPRWPVPAAALLLAANVALLGGILRTRAEEG